MIERLKDLLKGPDALQPWTLPAMPAPLVDLLPWRAWDEAGEFYVNAASCGFVLELPPFAGIDEGTLDALAGTLADSAPERSVVQVIHWTSPRYGAAIRDWAQPREGAGGLQAVMAARREALFSGAGWRPLHAGGPPFTLNDCRVFLTACLPGRPGPASETALGGFRRALEGALASIGTWARRLEPDGLLSLAAELTAPDPEGEHDGGLNRPERRWSPRDPIHLQCAAPGRAMSVAPAGLVFHHPAGTDVAVRVLSARAYPEVWPGWRGNALIGDFHRDFLQPGAPVLTALTVMMGEAADGERAFLKSARATQQAGTGIARYLPGLPEKARDWRFVTERLKEGERLVRASYTICVYAPLDGIDEAEQAVRAIYHGQGWRLGAERYAHLPGWLSCLPMVPAGGLDADLARMGRMKTLLTSSAVNLAPVHGEWRGQRTTPDAPPALLLVGRRGQPACWSPFANEAGNYNVAVTGKSGSGKSVLMQELVAGIAGAGGEAVVIDDGRSFQHTAEALGGAFIAFGKDPARLNPFAMIDAETAARDGDYREECFTMLAAVVGRMCRRRGRIDDIEAACEPGDDLIETRGLALAGRRAQRRVGREQDAFILRDIGSLPKVCQRDHVLLTSSERGPVPARVFEQVGGGREPERAAPSAEPVVEHDRRDLAALAASGAVAQHPAATEPDLRRERLTVLGSGCIDAHLAALFRAAADGLPAGAYPVAGRKMAVVGLAGEDDALDLGVRQQALGNDAFGQQRAVRGCGVRDGGHGRRLDEWRGMRHRACDAHDARFPGCVGACGRGISAGRGRLVCEF